MDGVQDLVVEDLPYLENLNISCTKVNDISALRKCRERLKYLSMFGLKFPAASGEAIVSSHFFRNFVKMRKCKNAYVKFFPVQ
jgi:hypothetical protein